MFNEWNNLINSERMYNTNVFYPLIHTLMQKILTLSLLLIISMFLSFSLTNAQSLTKNDQLFREDMQYKLDAKLQTQIMSAINGYKARIAKMNKVEADKLTDSIL